MSVEREPNPLVDEFAIPNVSFDIALGKELDRIDFNYSDYITHLKLNGVTNSDISKIDIQITPEMLGNDENAGGRYYWPGLFEKVDKHTIQIRVAPSSERFKRHSVYLAQYLASYDLLHETKHLIDRLNGKFKFRGSLLGALVPRPEPDKDPVEISAKNGAINAIRSNPALKNIVSYSVKQTVTVESVNTSSDVI